MRIGATRIALGVRRITFAQARATSELMLAILITSKHPNSSSARTFGQVNELEVTRGGPVEADNEFGKTRFARMLVARMLGMKVLTILAPVRIGAHVCSMKENTDHSLDTVPLAELAAEATNDSSPAQAIPEAIPPKARTGDERRAPAKSPSAKYDQQRATREN